MSEPRRSVAQRREDALARRARRAEVTDPDVVMQAAAAFIGARPRSVAETGRRLRHLGYPGPLCDRVVDRLVELGYLDDRAFARAWLESRDRAHPRGRRALTQELQRKGVPRDVIEEALEERERSGPPGWQEGLEGDGALHHAHGQRPGVDDPVEGAVELGAALRSIERRAASLARETDPRRRRQKAYALLARQGFAPDVCRRAAASVADAPTEDAAEDLAQDV